MSRKTLQEWLLSDPHFQSRFDALEKEAVRSQFPHLKKYESYFEIKADWPYLLFCASVLAPSNIPEAEERSLRIAQSALADGSTLPTERDAALVILDALANRRAIKMAQLRDYAPNNLESRLGAIQSIDWLRRSIESRIQLYGEREIHGNRFQQRFWENASNSRWLSVSAPTSAGKSFILGHFIVDKLASQRFSKVIYIAPTRALIQQVERDLRAMVKDTGVEDVEIRSIPSLGSKTRGGREILIFTQERLHYYLLNEDSQDIDALVIDESHKLGDGARGILLQDVIERVANANPKAMVIFTAPLADNPDLLLSDAPPDVPALSLMSDDSTVSQNLLWLEIDRENPKLWELSLRRGDKGIPLGTFETTKRLATIKSRLASLAILTDPGDGGILVYANGAARAEEIAEEIAKRLPYVQKNKAVSRLDELCRTTIHKDFALRDVLQKGVAFHYGNMPLILRNAIEDLFREGHIRYLVCTSTLVEGVNLPCRNILLHAPKKGGKPMSAADFWNLAGRAGRWGKEFQGNVICVDTKDTDAWGDILPRTRKRFTIERATDRILKEEMPLVEYVTAGAPSYQADKSHDLETAVSYLTAIRNDFGSITDAPWRKRIPAENLRGIEEVLGKELEDVEIPTEWVRRHTGISPFAMQRMLDALGALKMPIARFLPVPPEAEDSAQQYGRIFQLMGHHMTTVFGNGGRCVALGILTANWMLGYPINRIISERRSWLKKKKIDESLSASIRKVFEDVEQIARFHAPRYLACYTDIIRHELEQRNMANEIAQLPDLTLSLEFGVRGNVELSLMELGLSRSSTLAVANSVAMQLGDAARATGQLDPHVLERALIKLDLQEMSLPSLITEEIERLIDSFR